MKTKQQIEEYVNQMSPAHRLTVIRSLNFILKEDSSIEYNTITNDLIEMLIAINERK